MEPKSVKENLIFWMIEDYLESRNAGDAGLDRWRDRVRKSIESLLELSGSQRGSAIKGLISSCGSNDILPGKSSCQAVTPDKILYSIRDFIDQSYSKLLREEDFEELTTRGIINAKANFFLPGYTVAIVKSQLEGEETSEWVIEK